AVTPDMAQRRVPRWLLVSGAFVALVLLLIAFWNWDWFIPLVAGRASAALGRPVSIGHLHVGLGRTVHIEADQIAVGNPPSFPPDSHLATIDRLALDVDAMGYIRDRVLRIPLI